jgi:putative addiction module component (TIGR02574 family)
VESLLNSRYNLHMRRSYEEVLQIAHSLPEDQRILLANSLWDSVVFGVGEEDGSAVASAWDQEIELRLNEIDSGAVKLIPGDQVRAEMIARLSPQARVRLRV